MSPARSLEKAELLQALKAVFWAIGCAQTNVIRMVPSVREDTTLPKEESNSMWVDYYRRMEKLTSAKSIIFSLIREEEKDNA
jgi:hypothetical protein